VAIPRALRVDHEIGPPVQMRRHLQRVRYTGPLGPVRFSAFSRSLT
jgi:hypothetical protein